MSNPAALPFDNSYARLPERFYSRQVPTPVSLPELLCLNESLAGELGLDSDYLRSNEGVAILAGNHVPLGADPIAMAYAGHQFGGWAAQLGDGRAVLLGELLDTNAQRFDLQLKGSGRTPYSRMGDGRAWLGPVLREYIVSETMSACGVPTTRALAAVSTGDMVHREAPMPGAVLTRVARSHIRVGTFEYFAARKDIEGLRLLADHAIDRHYPSVAQQENRYAGFLKAVVLAQASLIAQWQGLGFIHGVMNTDNMSISGDTIDYGPCAFLDSYIPDKVFSSIDQGGRYAYSNQPKIAQWNLAVLAQCLLPLIDDDDDKSVELAQAIIDDYPARFAMEYSRVFRAKIGLAQSRSTHQETADDLTLVTDLLQLMADSGADFTNTFRALSETSADSGPALNLVGQFSEAASINAWLERWRSRLAMTAGSSGDLQLQQTLQSVNPAFIPRNHQIEAVIQAAVEGDLAPFNRLVNVLSSPFLSQADAKELTLPPTVAEEVHQTFCGT